MPLFGKKKGGKGSGILKNYEKLVHEAYDALKRGDSDRAIMEFRKLLRWITEDLDKIMKLSDEDKKKLSELITAAGEEMINLKDYDVAIKILEKAKTIDPHNFRAWMDIGKDLLQRNTQVPYALVCLREAAKLKPDDVEVHLLLGDAYRIQGQYDKALAAYQKALKVDPNNEDALQKVLKIQPENIDILERYIQVLESKGKKEDLVKAYNKIVSITGDKEYLERGLQLDPENKDLLMNKARILLREEKLEDAKEIVKKLKEMHPDDPDIQMLYDELIPTEPHEETPQEVESIEVSELFEDISLGEAPEIGFEEEGSMQIEGDVAGKNEISTDEESASLQSQVGEMASESEESPAIKSYEVSQSEEGSSEVAKVELTSESFEEKSQEIPPYEVFLKLYKEGKMEEASEILKNLSEENLDKLLDSDTEVLEFIYHALIKYDKKEEALTFINTLISKNEKEEYKIEKAKLLIEMGEMEEAEALLNDILKKNMKNGMAMYLKARIMSIKGVEMSVRNFLMMATKFAPELKDMARNDPFLEKYKDKEWFKKITS